MSLDRDLNRLSTSELVNRLRGDLVPLNSKVSYFFAALPVSEEDVQEYLREPFAALPPALVEALPPISVVMVPYLERVPGKTNGRRKTEDFVCFEKPDERERTWSSKLLLHNHVALVFGIKDQDVADYHYSLYRLLADVSIDYCDETSREEFFGVLSVELSDGVHGEVDEQSWQLKQALLRKKRAVGRKTKGFAEYARQSMLDTMTLYLHGICCDIDVETGPRQVASRHLRRRLELLHSIFPPPAGYAVFPEELNHTGESSPLD